MNQEHFLTELKIHLKPLPPQQIAYILQNYRSQFAEGLAAGKCEAVISQELGSPKEIAAHILAEIGIKTEPAREKNDDWQEFSQGQGYSQSQGFYHQYDSEGYTPLAKPSFFIRFCQVMGILALNAFFMIWFLLSIVLLVGAFWLVDLVLLFAPVFGLIAFSTSVGSFALFQLFISIFLAGLGILGLAIMLPLTRSIFRFLKYYCRWTFNTLTGRA